mmetsp:Transcript_2491/g.5854  ORF Transcript_2491/g.5854 Transcript_2491/m.5854 type:complete len:664 (-) Transcript_2491:276-2267(-)|eukprot:CAMPEP_0171100284 /NCGR_PEP_ID=MMETSP0766_2-20121228/52864_1 /TAXON_ID=439317 /ORGANISM="Gambierdiscus australes, Strain CAWD 149" /LENGTH=663 /DNA_ID=CAMNT_0011560083 /DNA_START=59 /DNA_END=2050 /DNA_ORIENTATION=+
MSSARVVTLFCVALAAAAHSEREERYDFVIVGGGLAGSVLANRLSASGEHSVLLLNVAAAPPKAYSGPVILSDEFIINRNITADDGLRARIHQPGYAPVPHFSTELTGSSPARMLGGSSLVALSLYLRDHPEMLDSWGEGWSWEELRPYFHRAEGLQGTETALRQSDYGRSGPYTIQELPAYVHPLTREFVRAAEASGLRWAPDLNTERGAGVGLTPTTQRADGSKVHAYDAYLRPALQRLNLEVRHGARADRLIIEGGECRGLAFRNLLEGSDHVVRARKEVILSSGYIYSPRLLFLSGIGARRDLEAVGLQVVKDLPAVGRNLTAARYSPLAWRTATPTLSEMMGEPISRAGLKSEPAAYGSAVLEATARARSAASARAHPQATRPDIVLSFMPLYYAPKSAPLQYSLQGEEWPLQTNAFSILATLGETKAQGSVTFPSGAPDVSPVITHDPMTDPEDLARAREAVDLARRIGGAREFTQTQAVIENGAGRPDMWTAVYDGRGTCRMGEEEHNSVVDHKLRVHGISKLRVVDGSVIPVGSPYLAVPEVLALAERASDLILGRHVEGSDVTAGGQPQETVTVPGLSNELGQGFSLMRGVSYLSAAQGERLSQVFAPGPSSSPTLPALWALPAAFMVLLAAAALSQRWPARETRESGYASLMA